MVVYNVAGPIWNSPSDNSRASRIRAYPCLLPPARARRMRKPARVGELDRNGGIQRRGPDLEFAVGQLARISHQGISVFIAARESQENEEARAGGGIRSEWWYTTPRARSGIRRRTTRAHLASGHIRVYCRPREPGE